VPDLRLTLEELERDAWLDPGSSATTLVRRCTELRRKPLCEFAVEDLRIMLGQQIGVTHLLPLAVNVLEDDPFAEGDFFPGDLLLTVLRLDWPNQRRDLFERMQNVVENLNAEEPAVAEALVSFRQNT
jgi:hypothetical protein